MKSSLATLLALALAACTSAQVGVGQKAGGETAFVCHKGKKTMELPREAVQAHLDHGDHVGPC